MKSKRWLRGGGWMAVGALSLGWVCAPVRGEVIQSEWRYPNTAAWLDWWNWQHTGSAYYPAINGRPVGAEYEVLVAVPHPEGLPYTVTLDSRSGDYLPVGINSLTLNSPHAIVDLSRSLVVQGDVVVQDGKLLGRTSLSVGGEMRVDGGRFEVTGYLGGAAVAGSGGEVVFKGARLENLLLKRPVTVEWAQRVTKVLGGLQFDGGELITSTRTEFEGEQAWTGSGVVRLRPGGELSAAYGSGPMTFGAGLTVKAEGVNSLYGILNNGTVEVAPSARVQGTFVNYDSDTLTLSGGRWVVGYLSSFTLLDHYYSPATVQVNDADIVLSAYAKFEKLDLQENRGSLTLNGANANASRLFNTGIITVGPGSVLSVTGGFREAGSIDFSGELAVTVDSSWRFPESITVRQDAVLRLKGPNGMTRLPFDTGSAQDGMLNVALEEGELRFESDHHLQGFRIDKGTARIIGDHVIRLKRWMTNGGAVIDVGRGAMVIEAHPMEAVGTLREVQDGIRRGFNLGWPLAIYSSAAWENLELFGIGAILNQDRNGNRLMETFRGEAVDASAIIVAYVLNGDTDLDGRITADDYARVDRGFLRQPDYFMDWRYDYRSGDLNYDGRIDLDDYVMIDAAYLYQQSQPMGAVPEPGFAGGMVVAGLMLRRRARRS